MFDLHLARIRYESCYEKVTRQLLISISSINEQDHDERDRSLEISNSHGVKPVTDKFL